ncbi:MAG: H-NS histone family protein [Brevirhabdus sp.]
MAGRKKMNLPDIKSLSLAELKSLEKKVAKAIATHEVRQKKAALQALEAKAKEMGYSLSELTGAEPAPVKKRTAKAGVAKYKNPMDAKQTWTGKGRRPQWVLDALEAGKSMDDLAV